MLFRSWIPEIAIKSITIFTLRDQENTKFLISSSEKLDSETLAADIDYVDIVTGDQGSVSIPINAG